MTDHNPAYKKSTWFYFNVEHEKKPLVLQIMKMPENVRHLADCYIEEVEQQKWEDELWTGTAFFVNGKWEWCETDNYFITRGGEEFSNKIIKYLNDNGVPFPIDIGVNNEMS
jgi:hypothetical protein